MFRRLLFFVLFLSIPRLTFAQPDALRAPSIRVPQVTFELTWKATNPQWFQIVIDSNGNATYQSQPHTEPNESPSDPYELKFTASDKLRKRVFDVAKELDYFKSDLKYSGKLNVASTGAKTLSYTADGKTSKANFDYSPNPKAQELTKIFQEMSSTFELGRQIEYSLRFDKLGVDQRLKQLESAEREHAAPGLAVLVPVLQKVLNDPTSMNISRQRVTYLIYAAKSEY